MVNVGLVGAGPWGRNLARNIAEGEQTVLAAGCDTDAAARRALAKSYPAARVYETFEQLLAHRDLQAVVIATPSRLHCEQTRQALAAGMHVLVEKPMCMTGVEAEALIRQAEQAGRVLMVGHTFLYSNLVHDVRRRVVSGELGEVLCIYGQRLNLGRVRSDVDALWNFAPHDISIACYLLDGWPRSVNARGASFVQSAQGVADVAFFQMDFDGGAFVGGHVSWLDPQKVRRMVVVGSSKMLVYDDIDTAHHIQIYDKSVQCDFQGCATDFSDFRTRVRAGDLVVPNVRLIEPLGVEITHFAECIRTGARPVSDGVNGLRVVSVLEAMSRSMRQRGAQVEVDYGAWGPREAAAGAREVAAAEPEMVGAATQ
ncbi:MAG TPA: Gfo/Idh/MocA family oxidoreductase [Phycisphaerae bacterium]|nr:Gfo/Idh/MocA family oxidoreductase [Phycisphaerae bacterium]HNU45246.1 Gfo/Idh/MocA family oxidoreductase [Phycisphaerae bacterium]